MRKKERFDPERDRPPTHRAAIFLLLLFFFWFDRKI